MCPAPMAPYHQCYRLSGILHLEGHKSGKED
uniref:Uncharacterized protein n=1 Tax=Arundo donax TaxID=35708 RepID=A0A0A9AU91_ARUDO